MDIYSDKKLAFYTREIYNYVIYYGVIFLVLIPAVLFGKRVFCHYFCWMAPFMVIGTKIRNLLHLPGVHIVTEKENCISCKKCNQKCPMGVNVVELVKNDSDFGTECIQCGACVDNCPKKAISYGFRRKKWRNGKYKENGLCFIRLAKS